MYAFANCSLFDRVKQKFEEYEYDEVMESSYRSSLFKMFNKTLTDGFFPLIIVDAPNHKVSVSCILYMHLRCYQWEVEIFRLNI